MWDDFLDRLNNLKDLFKQHGKILVLLSLALILALAGYWGYSTTPYARNARAQDNMRTIGVALEKFHDNSGIYPFTVKMLREHPRMFANFQNDPRFKFSDFSVLSGSLLNVDFFSIGVDPYGSKRQIFSYETGVDSRTQYQWIVVSLGPDGVSDLDLAKFTGPEELLREQIDRVYDPTNGLYSKGDMIYTREMHLRNQ